MADSILDVLDAIPHRQSTPVPKAKQVNQSIVDGFTDKFRTRLQDPTLGERFVAKIIQHLSEKQIEDALDYVERKATSHKGKAFVVLCNKMMNQ